MQTARQMISGFDSDTWIDATRISLCTVFSLALILAPVLTPL